MIIRNDLTKLRECLEQMVGQEIKLISRGGHKHAVVRLGTVEKTYPSIFVVKLHGRNQGDSGRIVSYSYTDVLTRAIELAPCAGEE